MFKNPKLFRNGAFHRQDSLKLNWAQIGITVTVFNIFLPAGNVGRITRISPACLWRMILNMGDTKFISLTRNGFCIAFAGNAVSNASSGWALCFQYRETVMTFRAVQFDNNGQELLQYNARSNNNLRISDISLKTDLLH